MLAEDLAGRGPLGPRSRDVQAFDPIADPFALETCTEDVEWVRRRDARLRPSRLWGLDVTAELHRVGVNLRHMGCSEEVLASTHRPARCDFGSSVLRTSSDFRLELERGSRILVAGRVFRVSSTEPFTENKCPLEEPFEGLSTNSEVVFAGEVRDA